MITYGYEVKLADHNGNELDDLDASYEHYCPPCYQNVTLVKGDVLLEFTTPESVLAEIDGNSITCCACGQELLNCGVDLSTLPKFHGTIFD